MDRPNATPMPRLLAAARELAELRELTEFPHCATRLLRELIPCDHAAYNAIDAESGRATVVVNPVDCMFDGGTEAFGEFAGQSPLVVRAMHGDPAVLRLSDHISHRELHRSDLYQHVYRMIEVEYQLAVQLPPIHRELGRPSEIVGLDVCRRGSDFTDEDALTLTRMRPLFAATLERLHELAMLRALASADEPESDRQLLLVDAEGSLAWANAAVLGDVPLVAGEPLPGALREWLGCAREAEPGSAASCVAIDGATVHARLIRDAYPDLDAIDLRLDRSSANHEALARLGLTHRQTEVLALACDGLTSARIADRLVLSRRTVEHHFEAIYLRLGVTNRSQAIAAALGIAHR